MGKRTGLFVFASLHVLEHLGQLRVSPQHLLVGGRRQVVVLRVALRRRRRLGLRACDCYLSARYKPYLRQRWSIARKLSESRREGTRHTLLVGRGLAVRVGVVFVTIIIIGIVGLALGILLALLALLVRVALILLVVALLLRRLSRASAIGSQDLRT